MANFKLVNIKNISGTASSVNPLVGDGSDGVTLAAGPLPIWKGTWDSGTTYNPGDAVYDTTAGSSFVCTATNMNQEPPNGTYWDELASKGGQGDQGDPGANGTPVWKGQWLVGTAYVLGDAVYDLGSSYVCNNVAGSTGNEPPNPTYWDVLAAGENTSDAADISGTAGDIFWAMPDRGTCKRVVIQLVGFTKASTTAISFPVSFTNAPTLSCNNTSLVIDTLSTSGITIPVATTETGLIVVEGI